MNGSIETSDTLPPDPTRDGANREEAGLRPILVLDTDCALLGLLDEWLRPDGLQVVSDAECATPATTQDFALVIVDLATPRHGSTERLQRIAREHPGTPVLALSSHFFPGVERTGAVARALGVACALAKPLSRDTLVQAVQSLVHR